MKRRKPKGWHYSPRGPVAIPGRYLGDKSIQALISVEIDWDKLIAEMGTKARYNKSHRSRFGAVTLTLKEIP